MNVFRYVCAKNEGTLIKVWFLWTLNCGEGKDAWIGEN